MKITYILFIFMILALETEFVFAAKGDSPRRKKRALIIKKMSFRPGIRINAYPFYTLDDKVESFNSNTEYFRGKITGGLQWGGSIEYMQGPAQGFELALHALSMEAPALEYYKSGKQFDDFSLKAVYVLAGGNRYFPNITAFEPFLGLQAGAAMLTARNLTKTSLDNATRFAWGVKGGVNFWPAKRIGLKIQAGLLSVINGVGGSFYFGEGNVGAGINTVTSGYQFYAGGGIAINLAK